MDQTVISLQKKLFGDFVDIAVYGVDEHMGKEILELAYAEGLRLQKIFNVFDAHSELSMLNAKKELQVSNSLLGVIKNGLNMSKKTEGKYDITLGKAFLQRKSNLTVKSIDCSYKDVGIEGKKVILKHPDILIDLGSIAKGHIGDKIADYLKGQGIKEGLVDARGDIVFFGKYQHIIGIQHPRDAEKTICSIRLSNQAVATSGDYLQFHESFDTSHILHQQDAISITVVAPTLEEADVFGTALFVLNEHERKNLMLKNEEIKALVITKELHFEMHNGFETLICEGITCN
jgi:FAD:protein FMN transferase